MRKLFGFALAVLALVACQDANTDKAQDVAMTTVEQVLNEGEALMDSVITVEGTVKHVCTHGGKKMFIFNEDPANAIKVVASEAVPSFDAEFQGSDVTVEGKVVEDIRIDEAYLANWEMEVKKEMAIADSLAALEPTEETAEATEEEHTHAEGEEHEHNGDCTHNANQHDELNSQLEKIAELRAELAESGKEALVYFKVECQTISIKETAEAHDHEGHDHGEEGHQH